MKEMGQRLKILRETTGLSQAKFAEIMGSTQSSVTRYENGLATPSVELLRKYADYFDVSMDYIFARCEEPGGKLYDTHPQDLAERAAGNMEMQDFLEMCFDPDSKMNKRLKAALLRLMEEAKDE